MLEWISWFGISLIYNVIYSYLYSKLNETEFAKINLKNIMIYIFVSFMYCVSLTFEVKVTMILFKLLWTIILLKFLYKDDLNKVSITSLLIYILFSIGEIVFSILFVYLLGINLDFCKNNVFGIIFTNFSIGVLNCLVFRIGIINKCVKNIIKFYVSKRYINFIFVTISSIFIIYFFIYQNYTGSIFRSNYLTVFSFFFFIIVFIIGYFKEKTDNNKLTTEYDQLIDYVKTYEEIIEEKSKNQHEYNNQLILIREMLGTRNKKTREYIDGILSSEKGLDESNWLNKFKNIPNGGLKGLIHYKVSEMLKKGIKVYIDINENVNTKKINKYLKDNLSDVSKIIGVYLDNAREAALESNDQYIIIEAECNEGQLDFSISNTYKGDINLNKVDSMGYSKKGKGRGYGLSLVKDIIDRRDDIEQYREFNGIYFVQKIRFKYKKNKT